jgi:hypothetical protein
MFRHFRGVLTQHDELVPYYVGVPKIDIKPSFLGANPIGVEDAAKAKGR